MVQKIIDGVQRFQRDEHPKRADLFRRLATAQTPKALFVTCSDARVEPALLTQSQPGDLFVIRNAGNLVPPYTSDGSGEAASIEYAVAVLKVAHIIVCGHSDCGAMTAVSAPHTVETLPAIKAWLRHAEPAKLANAARTHPSAQAELRALIEENVIAQLTHLATHPSVAEAMSEGKLTVHGWTYDIGTGRVLTLDSATRRFIELADATEAPAAATWAHRHPMPTPN